MFVDKDSIIVEGVSLGQYLTNVEYQYNKLWGEDTGRNLAGKFSGTLRRVTPKLVCNFRKLNETELQTLAPILNKKYQSLTYKDPEKGVITIQTYSGDWSVSYNNMNGKAHPFKISFIDTGTR